MEKKMNNNNKENDFFLYNPTMIQPQSIYENVKNIKEYYDYR